MAFNTAKFKTASFAYREAEIAVPELAAFFDDKQAPVWKVRGLSGEEISRGMSAGSRQKTVAAIAEALAASDREKGEAIKELLGANGAVPEDLAKRLDYLVSGSIGPEIDRETAVKIAAYFPITFYGLTNKILELSGEGAIPGKPARSSGNRTSKQP